MKYVLDGLPAPTGIFRQIQGDGNIDAIEMYRTFNMGVGFCVIAPEVSAEATIRTFKKHRMGCRIVGRVEKGAGVTARISGKMQAL